MPKGRLFGQNCRNPRFLFINVENVDFWSKLPKKSIFGQKYQKSLFLVKKSWFGSIISKSLFSIKKVDFLVKNFENVDFLVEKLNLWSKMSKRRISVKNVEKVNFFVEKFNFGAKCRQSRFLIKKMSIKSVLNEKCRKSRFLVKIAENVDFG